MVFSFRLITNNRKYSSRYGSILIRCSSNEYFKYTSPVVSNVYYIHYVTYYTIRYVNVFYFIFVYKMYNNLAK